MKDVLFNVKMLLRKQGYSRNAAEEICKWYGCTDLSTNPRVRTQILIPSD